MSDLKPRIWYRVDRAPRTEIGKPIDCVLWFPKSRQFFTGSLHNIDDQPAAGVGHLHGDAIAVWGASHFMLLDGPET